MAGLAAWDEALRSSYDPAKVAAAFTPASEVVEFPESADFFGQDPRRPGTAAADILGTMDGGRRNRFLEVLAGCACVDIVDELKVIASLAEARVRGGDIAAARKISGEAPRLIRKLAHDKYAEEFGRYIDLFKALSVESKNDSLYRKLMSLEQLMHLRSTDKGIQQ